MNRRQLEIPALVLIMLICFVLEAKLVVHGIRPALTLLPVFYVGLKRGPLKGALFGALVGAIADSLAGNILGPNLLAKGTAGILASMITGGFLRWTPLLGTIGLFAITWADGIMAYASLSVFDEAPTAISSAAIMLLVQATINSVAGVFIKPADEH